MLADKLRACKTLMCEVAINKDAVEENEREAARNKVFFDMYGELKAALMTFIIGRTLLDFHPSEQLMTLIEDALQETRNIFEAQKVVEPYKYRDLAQKCIKNIHEEWISYSAVYAEGAINDLEIIRMLGVKKGDINGILRKLRACQTWPMSEEIARDCRKAKEDAKVLLSEMHFDMHVSVFLKKVKSNTATLLDLTPEILEWIDQEQLAGRITLKIQV